jgi:hypothetical protein
MWQALQGNGFPYPYVEAAVFAEDRAFAYTRRPYLWSTAGAFHYPYVSPNARGDLGLTVYWSTPKSFPSPCFGVSDDLSLQSPPPWEIYRLSESTIGANSWGDYARNRCFQPSQLGWVTSVYTALRDPVGHLSPLFFILARERDLPSIANYWQV